MISKIETEYKKRIPTWHKEGKSGHHDVVYRVVTWKLFFVTIFKVAKIVKTDMIL